MKLSMLDGIVFFGFIAVVVAISLYASRKEKGASDYFLAGRNLSWWLIGFSLIASNISTEHFVGMAGTGFEAGLAVASYEWIAAIALVVTGLYLLPRFLKLGIYTMPEFLEHRYGAKARTIMAGFMLVGYVGVAVAAVLYSGALGLESIFGLDHFLAIWLIGILAGAYTIYGGLKAVVWSDLLQGTTLLIGGVIVAYLSFSKVGGLGTFLEQNADKLHMILPADDKGIPWTALFLGIWIPNFFYWGFNQFITQRTLGSRDLRQGQLGIMFAAFIKLLIPFIIVFPGIAAFQLYGDKIEVADMAYPILVRELLPAGLQGLMLAALFGAVMSSLDSMLNSASTIFTMDIYKRWMRPNITPAQAMVVGRKATAVLILVGCLMAPLPGKFEGVFTYIQMIWGFISPGIVAVFFFGLINRRAPEASAVAAMLLGAVLYGLLLVLLPDVAFLNHMGMTFVALVLLMTVWTMINPLPEPVRFKQRGTIDITSAPAAKWMGMVIVALTIMLYIIFW